MELTSSSTSGGQIGVINGSREVYDNPNYSHIMIGGQPFFILPSGELSDHVPVPVQADQLTPRKMTLGSDQHLTMTLIAPISSRSQIVVLQFMRRLIKSFQ